MHYICISHFLENSIFKSEVSIQSNSQINSVIDMKKQYDITCTAGSVRDGVGISDRKFCKSLSCILLLGAAAVVAGVDGAVVLVDDLLLPR